MDGCFKEGTGRREEEGWDEERKGVGLIKEENTNYIDTSIVNQ